MNKVYTGLLAVCLLFTACDKDDYKYPNAKTDLAELIVSGQNHGLRFTTDDGICWEAVNQVNTKELKTDSIYRFIVMYEPQTLQASNGTAKIFDLEWAISPCPIPEQEVKGPLKTDPVSLQSIWQSDRYLNMVLEMKAKDQEHKLFFVDQGITTAADGTRTLHILLYHDRANDVEGFTKKFCLSVPLWLYEQQLSKGDNITFKLQTKQGMLTKTFPY